MSDFIQIRTTTSTRTEAQTIAAELVARRLAGCVQVTGPIVSTYRWKGKVETAEEWMCLIKTGQNHLAAVQQAIGELHSYEVPEVVATPIVGGSEKYLSWLREQLQD